MADKILANGNDSNHFWKPSKPNAVFAIGNYLRRNEANNALLGNRLDPKLALIVQGHHSRRNQMCH